MATQGPRQGGAAAQSSAAAAAAARWTRGQRLGPGKPFCREARPVFVACAAGVGRVPPRALGLDHEADGPAEPGLGLEALQDKALRAGCVAFTWPGGRLLTALVHVDRWEASPGEAVFELTGADPPWHLVDVNMTVPRAPFALQRRESLRSLEVDVELLGDVPQSTNLYLCVLGGDTSRGHFYCGLQTCVGAPASESGIGPRLRPGPFGGPADWPQCAGRDIPGDYGAIFSRFGDANLGDVAIPDYDRCFAEAADYEGDFSSVRGHMNCLDKGKYTCRLVVEPAEAAAELAKPGSWVRFEVHRWADDSTFVVGWLFFPGAQPLCLASPRLYNFTEIYGEPMPTAYDHYEPGGFEFVVDNLRVNGTALDRPRTEVEYWCHVPLLASCSRATTEDDETTVPWHVKTEFAGGLRPDSPNQYGTHLLWP